MVQNDSSSALAVRESLVVSGKLLKEFDIPGEPRDLRPYGNGHIHDTYVCMWEFGDGSLASFVHQRLNTHVFRNVPAMMRNIELITTHIRSQLNGNGHKSACATLEVIPARVGGPLVWDEEDRPWRTYRFIPNSCYYEVCDENTLARESGKVCGQFHTWVASLDPALLVETIPDFHNSIKRLEALERAVAAAPAELLASAKREIDFAFARTDLAASLVNALAEGELPRRVSHNDLKFNNVLFDSSSLNGLCLVDLDTCMPGTFAFDFGDLVRDAAIPAAEDEQDLSKVVIDLERFKSILAGYAEQTLGVLADSEREVMATSAQVVALTLGVRFLTDYLEGDHYFKTSRPGHNLDRCRTQLRAVAELERHHEEVCRLIDSAYAG